MRYLDLICTGESFTGAPDEAVEPFDADGHYAELTAFYDSVPECESFPKEEYFSGGWYDRWEDYVIREEGKIVARAGIWQENDDMWEVAGVITRPEYRGRGYSARLVRHCAAKILEQGRTAWLTTAETNAPMLAAAKKAGFFLREP